MYRATTETLQTGIDMDEKMRSVLSYDRTAGDRRWKEGAVKWILLMAINGMINFVTHRKWGRPAARFQTHPHVGKSQSLQQLLSLKTDLHEYLHCRPALNSPLEHDMNV